MGADPWDHLMGIVSLFGRCKHKRYSWPQAVAVNVEGENLKLNYVACLDCGMELSYSLEEMKIGGPLYGQRINRCRIPASARVEAGEKHVSLEMVR